MAPRLSPSQQAALLGIPVRRDFIPEHTGFRWATLACLKSLRLIKGDGYGKKARHVITATGLKLRAELSNPGSDWPSVPPGLRVSDLLHGEPNG